MAHVGEERGFCAARFLRRRQLRLQPFVFPDPFKGALHQKQHDKHKNASAEKHRGDHQIRLSEDADGEVACQEQNEQSDRDAQDLSLSFPVAVRPEARGKTQIAEDVDRHQRAPGIYH